MKYVQAIENLKSAKSISEVEESFQKIAHALLNHTALEISGRDYRITEIEFYFKSNFFQDPFVHCDERQKTSNEWYFHRRGTGYKDGNYKGLDLTIGSDKTFGGILIRGLESLDGGNYFDGPSLVVDEILKQFNANKVIEVAPQIEKLSASSSEGTLKLKDLDSSLLKMPIRSPRVGLPFTKKDESLRTQYVAKDYRFHSDPLKTSKHRHTMFLALYQQGIDKKQAAELLGLRESEALKYEINFRRGFERNPTNYLDLKLSVLNHCEMLGSLNSTNKKAS